MLGWLPVPHATERAVIAACSPAFRNGDACSTASAAEASCSAAPGVEHHVKHSLCMSG